MEKALKPLILIIALLLPIFCSACGTDEAPSQETATSDSVTQKQTSEQGDKIKVFDLSAYSISAPSESANAAAYLQKVIKTVYGIELPISDSAENIINISSDGSELDWSVTLDALSGNVMLTGGSRTAEMRAVYAFLTSVCAADRTKPTVSALVNYSYRHDIDKTDNSSLLSYIPSNKVITVDADNKGLLKSPEWVDGLIIVEVRPDTASIGGTLSECYDLLDFYASVGVNGIWLSPIYERGIGGNGYGNYGPHTLEPAITGTTDVEEGWRVIRQFVDYAHSKGIYVFLDIITWGAMKSAPIVAEHPSWFSGEAWGNPAFNWTNSEFTEWFTSTLVDNILKTDADGYRCDCEPNYSGYDMFKNVRESLAKQNKYIIVISEDGNSREATYDFEQDGVLQYSEISRGALYQNPINFFADGYLNIVTAVQYGFGIGSEALQKDADLRGTFKYYTNCITNHDYQRRDVCGNRVNIGYSAILAPFIPLWYMGDEFNAQSERGVLYDLPVNYDDMNDIDNAFFLEDVRRMINIRRINSGIFESWTMNHRDSNICKVTVSGQNFTQSYARYADGKAILVIPNNKNGVVSATVTIPFDECGIAGRDSYTVTDLMTGRVILSGTREEIETFYVSVPYSYVGIFAVE